MNKYELTVILDGKTTPAKVKAYTEKLEKLLKILEGKIIETHNWGKKDFTYKIKKGLVGYYLLFDLELSGKGAKDLNTKLRTDEDLLRYLIVRV